MGHHTKDKGDLGVAKAHADLVSQGFMVLWPTTEHAPFDLVAYDYETFLRVQVKYRAAKNGHIELVFKSSWADSHGTHTRPIDKSLIDVICVYCPDTDECYYLWPADWRSSATFRFSPPANGQRKHVTLAESLRVLTVPRGCGQQALHLGN